MTSITSAECLLTTTRISCETLGS